MKNLTTVIENVKLEKFNIIYLAYRNTQYTFVSITFLELKTNFSFH